MATVDKVYVINLDRSRERLEEITKNLRDQEIMFERVAATDGNKLSRRRRRENATFFCANFCTDGQLGCGMSHMKIWKAIVKDGVESALILEDDARLTDNFMAKLSSVWSEIPSDFDIVYIGCLIGCEYDGRDSLLSKMLSGRLTPFSNKTDAWKRISTHVFVPSFPLGTHCYIISLKGAAKLLGLTEGKVDGHIDFQIQEHSEKIKMYAIHPTMAVQIQKQSSSTITTGAFPLIPMRILDSIYVDGNMSLSYFINCPAFQIGPYVVNTTTSIFFVLGVYFALYPKYLRLFLTISAPLVLPDLFVVGHIIPLIVSLGLILAPGQVLRLWKTRQLRF